MSRSINSYLNQLATALDVTLTKERVAIYIAALSDLSAAHLDHAFKHALKYFKPEFGVMFPVPAELRQWAQEYNPEAQRDPTRDRLPEGKPPGWEEGITVEDTRRMLAEAIDRLSAQKAMNRPDGRTLHEQQRAQALARLGGSTMPTDPAARQEWASQMAEKNGWKRRELGEDEG